MVDTEEKISISIFDMEGRLVEKITENYTASPGLNEFEYEAGNLGKGIYFAVINSTFDSKKIKIASLK